MMFSVANLMQNSSNKMPQIDPGDSYTHIGNCNYPH